MGCKYRLPCQNKRLIMILIIKKRNVIQNELLHLFCVKSSCGQISTNGNYDPKGRLYLQGNEEEGVPEDGVGVTLPHQHVVGESLGQELVAVVEVDAHPDQDRQQGEQLELRQIENKDLRKYRQLLPEFR